LTTVVRKTCSVRPLLWSVDMIEHTFGEQIGEQIEA
jgi:hypothetical protein